ncbi:hypothetical protein Tco_1107981 [Tanacetum coccineum]
MGVFLSSTHMVLQSAASGGLQFLSHPVNSRLWAASDIHYFFDSSDEKTSTIAPVISSAAPMVETTLVASPIGLCGLVPYTGSNSNPPDEMTSPEHISQLPAISPLLEPILHYGSCSS